MTEKLTRAERRQKARLYGFGGNKSSEKKKYRQRDAVNGQTNWAITLWGRWSRGKKLDELNLDEFFEENKGEFCEEVALELKERLALMIDNQKKLDEKAKSNPIKQ